MIDASNCIENYSKWEKSGTIIHKKKRDRSQGGEISLNQIYITLPS